MKGRHQADLVWRFQHAEEQAAEVESLAEARVSVRERRDRIDAVLSALATKPVGLARVLFLRYAHVDTPREIRLVLRENAAVAAMIVKAASLGAICARIGTRHATGEDTVVIDEVRRAAEALVEEAERAYEARAEGKPRAVKAGGEGTKKLKAFYTTTELARAIGISRWTMRRWLDRREIPYEMVRARGSKTGGRIVVLVSELRTFAPSYFSSIREVL